MAAVEYEILRDARTKELAYIAGELKGMRVVPGQEAALSDLRAWLENRRQCFQANTGGQS